MGWRVAYTGRPVSSLLLFLLRAVSFPRPRFPPRLSSRLERTRAHPRVMRMPVFRCFPNHSFVAPTPSTSPTTGARELELTDSLRSFMKTLPQPPPCLSPALFSPSSQTHADTVSPGFSRTVERTLQVATLPSKRKSRVQWLPPCVHAQISNFKRSCGVKRVRAFEHHARQVWQNTRPV